MKALALENVSIIYLSSSSQAKCTNLTSLVCLLTEVALGCGRVMSGKRELVFCYILLVFVLFFLEDVPLHPGALERLCF